MPTPALLSVEGLFYILGAWCLSYIIKRKEWEHLALFISILIYSTVIEFLTLHITKAYHYGDFLLKIAGFPLWVSTLWAVIVYTSMCASDLMNLPRNIKPFYDALLTVMVELAIDPVSVQLKFWFWHDAGRWFDVPYANYFGWFNAVFIFSWLWRTTGKLLSSEGITTKCSLLLRGLFTIAISAVLLGFSDLVYYLNLPLYLQEVLLLAMFSTSVLLVILFSSEIRTDNPVEGYLLITISAIYLYFFIAILVWCAPPIKDGIFIGIFSIFFILSLFGRSLPFLEELRIPRYQMV